MKEMEAETRFALIRTPHQLQMTNLSDMSRLPPYDPSQEPIFPPELMVTSCHGIDHLPILALELPSKVFRDAPRRTRMASTEELDSSARFDE